MGVEVGLGELQTRLEPLGVDSLTPLTGGASSLTYAGRIDERRGGARVVVKVAPAGLAPVRNRDVLRQARLLKALRGTDVPVPEILWEDAGDPPEVPPLFVMAFVEGTSVEPLFDLDGTDLPGVVADRMRNAARVMAALHALAPADLGLGDEPVIGSEHEVERWARLLDTVDPHLAPGWQQLADALRASVPPSPSAAVVHGDYRLGNMLGIDSEIAAIIDWEIWSVGDPRIDLGWFLVHADQSTYTRRTPYVDAMPAPAELVAIYRDASGRALSDLDWFRALACFKSTATWAAIVKHNRRRDDPDPALEDMTKVLPRLLTRVEELLRGRAQS